MRPGAGTPPAKKPYDLNLPPGLGLPPGYDPDDPKHKAQPDDLKLPADPKKQVDLLADAIARTQDAVKRDKLVRALRDAVAKIQPVMSDKDAKKQIDKAIDSLIESGSKKLLLDLITAIVGKGPSQQPDPDQPHPVGPAMKEKDLGEHIIKSPEIPIGKPPAVHRNSFEFRGLPKTARPSSYISFKLITPDWFDPNKTPGSWVMIMTPADHAAKQAGRQRHRRAHREQGHAEPEHAHAGRSRKLRHRHQDPVRLRGLSGRGDRAQEIVARFRLATDP